MTLKAALSYRFSDRATINIDFQQIAEGKNVGDFLYDAKTRFLLSRAGQITLGAYSQNKSPEQLFERAHYQFHQWDLSFKKTKINNLSFLYENSKLSLAAKAECFTKKPPQPDKLHHNSLTIRSTCYSLVWPKTSK